MSKRERIVWGVIAAICIILTGITLVFFFPYRTSKVDWNLHGYLITADGEVKEELDFSVKGKIRDYKDREEMDQLRLNFTLPDPLPNKLQWADNQKCFLSDFQLYFDVPYYVCHAYAHPVPNIESSLCVFALDPIQKYVIIKWGEESGQLLVASADPTVSAEEILKHFQRFLNFYVYG